MKRLVGFGLILLTLVLVGVQTGEPAFANNLQQGTTWSAAIAYFNPTVDDGELTVSYYPEDGNGFTPTVLSVNSLYSGTVLVGATPGMEGSAVLSSNFQMPAIYKIAASSGNPYSVIMLEFFNTDQVGTGDFYLPLVYRQTSGYVSRIGIQNIENVDIDVDLTFVNSNGTTYTASLTNIEPQSSEVFKTTEISALDGVEFNGSLMIEATLSGTSTPARVAAASADIRTSDDQIVHSIQGAREGSTTLNIPVVYCNYGRTGLTSVLHFQNVSGGSISANSVTITYYDASGAVVDTYATHAILADGQRAAVDVCAAGAEVAGKKLSATIQHSTAQMVGVVETQNNQGLAATSMVYTNFCSGTCNIALPYVEWSSSDWDFQTTLYIMNTGSGPADILATFYRRDSTNEQQTYTDLPVNAMVETNPNLVTDLMGMQYRDFKGAVMVQSDQPVMVIALVTKRFQAPDGSIQTNGDSYIGIEFIP